MHIDVLTLFPEMFPGVLNSSILKRAQEKGLLTLDLHNIRDYANNKHRTVDDYPYGGGPGMVLQAEPVVRAVRSVLAQKGPEAEVPTLILLTPQGRPFTQKCAGDLAKHPHLILVCGHYEGIDERVRQILHPEEISIGDYILTGGEIPALVLIDAVTRLIPEVLGVSQGGLQESFYQGLLEYPQYTRPRVFEGLEVPEVLLSGNHQHIAQWRQEQSIQRTQERRPDLLHQVEDLSHLESGAEATGLKPIE